MEFITGFISYVSIRHPSGHFHTHAAPGRRRRRTTITDRSAEAKPGGKLVALRRDDAAAKFLGAQQGPNQAEEGEVDDGSQTRVSLIIVRH